MITINGKVTKLELNADSSDETVGFVFKNEDPIVYIYMHCMFKGKAPFQLGEEVNITISSKRDELPAQIV